MKLLGFFLILIPIVSCNNALLEFTNGNRQFTAKLYREIAKSKPGQNFIFSPFSVEVVLALTRAGAKGITASEFGSALNLPSIEQTEQALRKLLPQLKINGQDLKLLSANKLYLGKQLQILNSFRQLATGTFNAETENVDFSQNVNAANTINRWVEQQTNNKIQNLISPDSINGLTRLVLVNALYFFGKWATPFGETTFKQSFHINNQQKKDVDMMYVSDTFKYYESRQLNAKFLELPYRGSNITMTICLPNTIEGLAALENDIELLLAPQNLQYERVEVRMPTFLVESTVELKPILENLGLKKVFSQSADLSGISPEGLMVDQVIQKAFINVTTGGTEAAAATAVYLARSGKHLFQPRSQFIADHPFVYFIKSGDVVLFSGTIINF